MSIDRVGERPDELHDPGIRVDENAETAQSVQVVGVARGERKLREQPHGPPKPLVLSGFREALLCGPERRCRYRGAGAVGGDKFDDLLPPAGLWEHSEADVPHLCGRRRTHLKCHRRFSMTRLRDVARCRVPASAAATRPATRSAARRKGLVSRDT